MGRDAVESFWQTWVEAGMFDVDFLVRELRDGDELAFAR